MEMHMTNTKQTITGRLWILMVLALVAVGGLAGGCNKGGGEESREENPNVVKIKARLPPIFNAIADAAAHETNNCNLQERRIDDALAPFRTQAQEIHALAQTLKGADRFDTSILNALMREHIGSRIDLADHPPCYIRTGTRRLYSILRPGIEPFDWPEHHPGPVELVVVQPSRPGPFGILGMLKLGMSLKDVYAAQPAFEPTNEVFDTQLSYPGGPQRGTDLIRVHFIDNHEIKAGAFPWAWTPQVNAYYAEESDTEMITVFVTAEGIAHPVPGSQYKYRLDPNQAFLRKIQIIIETKTHTRDTFIQPLIKLWGEPARDGRTHYFWHNDPDNTCVIFADSDEPNAGLLRFDIHIFSCQTPAEYLNTILAAPNSSNAIVGVNIDVLSARMGADRFRTDGLNDPFISFLLPDISPNKFYGRNHRITLDANKKITALLPQLYNRKSIALDSNQQFIPLRDALAVALKDRVPAEVLAAAQQAPQIHKLDNGLFLTVHLPSDGSITLTVNATEPPAPPAP